MFTLENVFEKRAEFENACKRADACKDKVFNSLIKRLVSAKTEAEFLQAIFNNFYGVYEYVSKFGLEYDYVGDFHEGFARAYKDDKWGFINTKFEKICKLEYDDVGIFNEGFAKVLKGKKLGKLYADGREEF